MMHYPTGMGPTTGHHYYTVAARLHAYANNPYEGYTYPVQDYYPYQSFGTQVVQYTAEQLGIHPAVATEVEGFARSFMYNLLS